LRVYETARFHQSRCWRHVGWTLAAHAQQVERMRRIGEIAAVPELLARADGVIR